MGGRGSFSPAAMGRIRQAETRVNKGIKSYQKRISEHEGYIRNPQQKYGDRWAQFDKARQSREINHWQSEIKAFKDNIKKLQDKLQEVINENRGR